MSVAVKLSDQLIAKAKHHAHIYHRSVPRQIEYWSNIGKIAEENPSLPYSLIKDITLALGEQEDDLDEYAFSEE